MDRFALDNRFSFPRLLVVGVFILAVVAAPAGTSPLAHHAMQAASGVWKGPDGEPLPFGSDEEIIEFMIAAEIESMADIELGVTNPRRVVLEKDGVRMRAALRDYDETFEQQRFDGVFYARLRDSFVFDVAAFELSRLLGLANVPPVAFRQLGATRVTLQAWLEGGMMETDRIQQDIEPPSARRFHEQTQNMRVFDSLIGNVDRNSGNILMDADWNFWLIDHSRAFMRNDDTKYLERVVACSRPLFESIQALTLDDLLPIMSPPLSESEVEWVLRRRDKVVAHINALIEEKGAEIVLFDETP